MSIVNTARRLGVAMLVATALFATPQAATAVGPRGAAGFSRGEARQPSVTAQQTDFTANPPGANDWSCRPVPAHPRPVVLVHGTLANQYENWLTVSPLLKSKGYCVFALTYGLTPDSWTSTGNGILLPIGGLAPVAGSAAQLGSFVDRVRAATGSSKVDIVGHSQGGGLMPRYYMKYLGGAAKVNALVGLAPSNHGTTLSGIANLASTFPGVADLVYNACPACKEQVVGSELLTRLNAGGDTIDGVQYTVISTRYDEVITPYRTQALAGASNHVVQDHCIFAFPEHAGLIVSPTALHLMTNALDPAHATPVFCG